MRGSVVVGLMVVIALLASSVMPVDAGGRVFVGVGVGVPFWYPYPYVYPYPAYSPPVVVPPCPPSPWVIICRTQTCPTSPGTHGTVSGHDSGWRRALASADNLEGS
jgi:hypothetical protein